MKSKYPGVRNGQVEAAINMMGGMDGVHRFLSGKVALHWNVWKTIKLGTGLQTANDFKKALKREASQPTIEMMRKPGFEIRSEEVIIELVVLTPADLGFPEGARSGYVFERAQGIVGLDLCPPEVGPQLRLQYRDQPKGELLTIAMQPIPVVFESREFGRSESPCVFMVNRDMGGGYSLHFNTGGIVTGSFMGPDRRCVFWHWI